MAVAALAALGAACVPVAPPPVVQTCDPHWRGYVLPSDHNYAGIGAYTGSDRFMCKPTPRQGVRAQIQHLRNYADPAKDERSYPGIRVVTHAGRLRPARDPNADGNHSDTDDCEFRVFAYRAQEQDTGAATVDCITLEIPGVNLAGNVNQVQASLPASLWIRQLVGGVDMVSGTRSGSAEYYGFDDPEGLPATAASR